MSNKELVNQKKFIEKNKFRKKISSLWCLLVRPLYFEWVQILPAQQSITKEPQQLRVETVSLWNHLLLLHVINLLTSFPHNFLKPASFSYSLISRYSTKPNKPQ